MSEPKSREGTTFGHYRLLRLIGKGGMGEVYEAEDTVKDRTVALKLLPEVASHDPVFRKRLQREAHSAGRLQEPHVVPIHDYGEIDGVLFVDMRMIVGSDLRKILTNFGPMTPARAVAIVRQIASALDAAHESGVMHRDVKPENILLNRDDFAYLVDFGIANAATDEKLTELGTAVGTYHYMAPERFTSGEVTYRADVYALACVLYECLAGAQPFGGNSVSVIITSHLMNPVPRPSDARPGIPTAFDDVVARGMAKDPGERYASAGDLATAANDALTARDRDHAATILRKGEAATTPGAALDPSAGAAAPPPPPPPPPYAPTPPPPGAGPYPYATPTPAYGTPPPYGPTPPPYGMAAPPGGGTPASFPTAQAPMQPPYGYPGAPPPPPGGQSWNASPPGGGPPGGKKTPWVAIAIVAAVLVLVLGAVGIVVATSSDDEPRNNGASSSSRAPSSTTRTSSTRTSKTRTSTSESPSSNGSAEATLRSLIPATYPVSACDPVDPPAGDAVATIDCGQSALPGGPALARFSIYASLDLLNDAFSTAVAEDDEVLRCPTFTSDSPTTWHFADTPDVSAGQIACGTYEGRADVTWSQDADLMLGVVESDDLASLHDWWLHES